MSSGYLLDTSVLSMLAPGKPAPTEAFSAWLRERTDRLYLSTVTIAEIEQSIRKLRRTGGTERADRLSLWLDMMLTNGAAQILSLDSKIAWIAGAVSDKALAAGRHPGFADVAIAATAIVHDLLLLTRNGKHFAPLGVPFADPADEIPQPG